MTEKERVEIRESNPDIFITDWQKKKWSYRAVQWIYRHPYISLIFIIICLALFIYFVFYFTGGADFWNGSFTTSELVSKVSGGTY